LLFSPTLTRFAAAGLGVVGSGNRLVAVLAFRIAAGEPPKDDLRFPCTTGEKAFFCASGLLIGEYGEPPRFPLTTGLPRPESGELA